MNLNAIATALTEIQRQVDLLRTQLAEEQAGRDPFAAFLYRARKAYRAASMADHSKSGKRAQRDLEQLYWKAERLGFRGSIHEWHALLCYGSAAIGKPAPAPEDPDRF